MKFDFDTAEYANADETIIRCQSKPNVWGTLNETHLEAFIASGITPADYAAPPATWASVRGKRNQLLRDTDWQGMSDVTMSDAQTAYRKKLRDLPATNADPTKIVFPNAP
jgi:hypothetical protein